MDAVMEQKNENIQVLKRIIEQGFCDNVTCTGGGYNKYQCPLRKSYSICLGSDKAPEELAKFTPAEITEALL